MGSGDAHPAGAAIVIPLLAQEEGWLQQAVLSALEQSVPTDVIVVVSGRTPASNMHLLDALSRRHVRLSVVTPPPHAGFAGAINRGIEASSPPRVGLLFSDDWVDPEAVETCLRYDADIVSTGLTIYDAGGTRPLSQRRLCTTDYEALPTLESKACYLKHFFLFRKEKLLEVGCVDESVGLTGPDDYDLVWTLLEHGATVAVTPRPLYGYRDHWGPRLTLRPREEQLEDLEKILDKHGVEGAEKQRLLHERSMWYGRPYHATERLIGSAPTRRKG